MKPKLSYIGIRVKDLDASIEFYSKLLGMKVTGRSKIEATRGQTVALVTEDGGFSLELNYYEEGSQFNTKYATGDELDHIAFRVENLDEALAEAKNSGHPLTLEMKTGTSRWAYIKDPNGIFIELFA